MFVDFWKFTKIWKGLRHMNTELFLFWQTTDKHSSFNGLIQEDIDLSDIYYAVIKFMFIQLFSSQIILVFQGDLYVF